MKTIKTKLITDTISQLVMDAALKLRPDVIRALRRALKREKKARAKESLKIILKNAQVAREKKIPICQDTGMTVVYVDVGDEVRIVGDLEKAITEGVKQGTERGYLRRSIVHDPLERKNTGTNTPAIIHYTRRKGKTLKFTVLLKGFGCENKGKVHLFNPTASLTEIEDFIVTTAIEAGANACPPFVIGVGMGGTMDKAASLAKEILCDPVGKKNTQKKYAALEGRLLKKINAQGCGPLGLGGKTTALAVKVKTFPTHIAGLPVAVNINCHALRSAKKKI